MRGYWIEEEVHLNFDSTVTFTSSPCFVLQNPYNLNALFLARDRVRVRIANLFKNLAILYSFTVLNPEVLF